MKYYELQLENVAISADNLEQAKEYALEYLASVMEISDSEIKEVG